MSEARTPDVHLSATERYVLLVLMAEARELTNAELHALAGITLDGEHRRRLNELDLVASTKVGRAFVHELTDRGTVWCARELVHERPLRSGGAGGALYAVLGGLHRHLADSGNALADVFQPDVAREVENAYARLSRKKAVPIRLAVLREHLDDLPKSEFDRGIELLARRTDVHVRAEADQKTLTEQDRDAAIVLGGTPRHLLTIEAPR
ncbi:hypothetical protein [Nocardia callitridis]|uniref:MarR family transcriptional regulator n=1 Tax=Nocardia callitridis TaxID=648753 RepID=A0ABP9KQJ6_9NOCA